MQDSAMLNAKPKLSVVPGTLCFIAAGRNMGYCIFYVSFLSHCSVWGTPKEWSFLTTASEFNFTFFFFNPLTICLSSK